MASTIRTDKIGPADGSADFTLPTADGSAKSALITDGSKALSFATGTPSASNFLRGDGTWAAAGMVLQVLEDNLNTTVSSTSTSYVASGLTITITPASTSSRFLLTLSGGALFGTINYAAVDTTFYVGGSEVSDAGPYEVYQFYSDIADSHSAQMVHSPATVSATTYAVFYRATTGPGGSGTATFNTSPKRVVFTVMELAS